MNDGFGDYVIADLIPRMAIIVWQFSVSLSVQALRSRNDWSLLVTQHQTQRLIRVTTIMIITTINMYNNIVWKSIEPEISWVIILEKVSSVLGSSFSPPKCVCVVRVTDTRVMVDVVVVGVGGAVGVSPSSLVRQCSHSSELSPQLLWLSHIK